MTAKHENLKWLYRVVLINISYIALSDYNLQYSEYSCAHYAHIFRSSIIFQVWVVTEVGEHCIPFLARLYEGGIVYSGLSWNNNSNYRHWFYWEEWACGVAVVAFSCIISLHSWLKLSWSSGFQKPLVNIRRFQFQGSPTNWRQG